VTEGSGGGGAAGFSMDPSGVPVLELVVIVNCARCKHNERVGLGEGHRRTHTFISRLVCRRVERGPQRSCLGSEKVRNRAAQFGYRIPSSC